MRTIKFSHRYNKMPLNLEPTYILAVIQTYHSHLGQGFIEYDTKVENGGYFPLPRGTLILIMLYTDGQLWTTIRRHTPDKFSYYIGLIGQEVKIEVKENV